MTLPIDRRVQLLSRIPIGTHLTAIRAEDYGSERPAPNTGVFAGLRTQDGRDMIWLKRDLGSQVGQLVAVEEIHSLGVELDPELRPRGDS